jgi:hypothetical protein
MVVKLSDFLNTSFSTFSANDTNNTGITYPGAVVHNTTLTPGVGIGAGLDYQVETTNNNTETGMRLEAVTTDVTAGSEDFDFVVKLMQNGAAAAQRFKVSSSGIITINSGINANGSLGTNNQVLTSNGNVAYWTNSPRLAPRVLTTTSSATPTINTNDVDVYGITALAVNITSFTTNLTGSPTDGQKLWIYIVGTAARTITWGASFEASTVALPTTTVSTNRLDVGFVWNAATSKWRCVGSV